VKAIASDNAKDLKRLFAQTARPRLSQRRYRLAIKASDSVPPQA
jgi:hypothetical protein